MFQDAVLDSEEPKYPNLQRSYMNNIISHIWKNLPDYAKLREPIRWLPELFDHY